MSKLDSIEPRSTKKLARIGRVDLLIGIPTYNCAHTVGYVLHQVADGLAEYFPDHKSLIFVSDGGSQDGTDKVVQSIKLRKANTFFTTYKGVSGKGSAIKAIFDAASSLNAKAVAIFDSDLRSITPEWCKTVLGTILEEADLVTPYYVRHKYDGTITNNLCYPFTQAVYGLRIRQPIGGDFGFSGALIEKLIKSSLWNNPYIRKFGVDIFLTHSSIAQKSRIKEAFLGSKLHEPKDPGAELKAMFIQVVGSMFTCAREYKNYWHQISQSKEVPLIRIPFSFPGPEPVKIDSERLYNEFRKTLTERITLLKRILHPELLESLDKVTFSKDFQTSPHLWAKIVYSFASSFMKETKDEMKDHLLVTLRGLWLGKVYSFLFETETISDDDANQIIEREADVFEEMKPFFLSLL